MFHDQCTFIHGTTKNMEVSHLTNGEIGYNSIRYGRLKQELV